MPQSEPFRNSLGENVFRHKYAQGPEDSWRNLAIRCVNDVCGTMSGTQHPLLSSDERSQLVEYIATMKFIPGGRYLYYAGRPKHAWNNCYLLKAEEDTREEWGELKKRASNCLMLGGGIGIDYSILRPEGRVLASTGGVASGPLPLMEIVNAIGRGVMQGGSRRSAIYASLDREHGDVDKFLHLKDWHNTMVHEPSGLTLAKVKESNFNFPATLDQTNISVNYSDSWLNLGEDKWKDRIFLKNVAQAMTTGEPGFSFNFGDKAKETLRNACTEVTSEDDSDVCNLGSINLGNIETLEEFKDIVSLASKFLVCGTIRADLPYEKVYEVREKNRRLGLGLMGLHEWLLKRNNKYVVTPELRKWLEVYKNESEASANEHCNRLYLSKPVAYRAIAPTGTIGILAGTTTGIEPVYAVAYKRRYLTDGTRWKYEFCVDGTAQALIETLGVKPSSIDTAHDLSANAEQRISFQADVQDYVDQSISSTINLPNGKDLSPEDLHKFAKTLATYAPRLRGFTCYPDGSRGGQPISVVPYDEAIKHKGVVYEENDPCGGGVCGV